MKNNENFEANPPDYTQQFDIQDSEPSLTPHHFLRLGAATVVAFGTAILLKTLSSRANLADPSLGGTGEAIALGAVASAVMVENAITKGLPERSAAVKLARKATIFLSGNHPPQE